MDDADTNPESTDVAAMPCPDWCVLPAGHGIIGYRDDLLLRTHESAGLQGGERIGDVVLLDDEVAASEHGPVVSHDTYVSVEVLPTWRLTGSQLRRLASALLDAADEWDRAVGL